jgi:HlyD family secretion protein
MTANVSFVYATRAHAVRIANAALRFKPDPATVASMTGGASTTPSPEDPDARVVWLLAGGSATPKVIRLGIGDGVFTEIAGGDVHAGEVVVTEAAVADGTHHGS